jgi:hypothetical protein
MLIFSTSKPHKAEREKKMKYKTTAKEIRNSSAPVIAISYCGAQALLNYRSPEAYTCGVYGWNFDVYRVHGVVICTGYRGMVGIAPNYDTLNALEKQAITATPEQCDELLKQLINSTLSK